MKFYKKVLSTILAGIFTFGSLGITQAATRDEISAIKVSKSGKFNYWTKDSAVKQQLINYVKDITNKNSNNYVPVEDRIATFDMDGTLICETAPYYFDQMIYLERALYDKNYEPSVKDRKIAELDEIKVRTGKRSPEIEGNVVPISIASVFSGMSETEFENYMKTFMQKPVEGLSNLTYGESIYLPMAEVVRYLQANDFTVYVVSGADGEMIRILICEPLKIKSNNVIGMDVEILSNNQKGKDGLKYDYEKGDYLIRGGFVIKCSNMNKVTLIDREIGKKPILAFGNSSGDKSMLNFAVDNNKYKSLAFMILCDDVEREFGSKTKAEQCAKIAEENGWISISMRDDWKTIYGDNVKRIK